MNTSVSCILKEERSLLYSEMRRLLFNVYVQYPDKLTSTRSFLNGTG